MRKGGHLAALSAFRVVEVDEAADGLHHFARGRREADQ
jgi:hypothetical protein